MNVISNNLDLNATSEAHKMKKSSINLNLLVNYVNVFIYCIILSSLYIIVNHGRDNSTSPHSAWPLMGAEAGSKSSKASSKTTVIAIDGGGGGVKAHPVPVPWPVVHCHHHHHHMKYIPKPVVVHHWIKKYKPAHEFEASAPEHMSLGSQLIENHDRNSHPGLINDEQHNPFENVATAPQITPSVDSDFANSDKLSFELSEGSRLVSTLNNVFDDSPPTGPNIQESQSAQHPEIHQHDRVYARLRKDKGKHSENLIQDPDVNVVSKGKPRNKQSDSVLDIPEKPLSNRTSNSWLSDESKNKSEKTKPNPETIKSSTNGQMNIQINPTKTGKPNHLFDNPNDQLIDESRHTKTKQYNNDRFSKNLDLANAIEQGQAKKLLDKLTLEQTRRIEMIRDRIPNLLLASMNNRIAFPIVRSIMSNQRVYPPRPYIRPNHIQTNSFNPAIDARAASVISESQTIDLMTKLANQMVQTEAKKLIETQKRQLRNNKTSTNTAQSQAETEQKSLFRRMNIFSSIFNSSPKNHKDKRRVSSSQKFIRPDNMIATMRFNPERLLRKPTTNLQKNTQTNVDLSVLDTTRSISMRPVTLGYIDQDQSKREDPQLISRFPQNIRSHDTLMNDLSALSSSPISGILEPNISIQRNNNDNLKLDDHPRSSAQALKVSNDSSLNSVAMKPNNSFMMATTLSPDLETKFYYGQKEHLSKLQVRAPKHQPIDDRMVNRFPISPHSNVSKAYSSQSSDVYNSIIDPATGKTFMSNKIKSDSGLDSVDDKNGAYLRGEPDKYENNSHQMMSQQEDQYPMQTGRRDITGTRFQRNSWPIYQQVASENQQVIDPNMRSYIEFPLSPQQWSSEAIRSINNRDHLTSKPTENQQNDGDNDRDNDSNDHQSNSASEGNNESESSPEKAIPNQSLQFKQNSGFNLNDISEASDNLPTNTLPFEMSPLLQSLVTQSNQVPPNDFESFNFIPQHHINNFNGLVAAGSINGHSYQVSPYDIFLRQNQAAQSLRPQLFANPQLYQYPMIQSSSSSFEPAYASSMIQSSQQDAQKLTHPLIHSTGMSHSYKTIESPHPVANNGDLLLGASYQRASPFINQMSYKAYGDRNIVSDPLELAQQDMNQLRQFHDSLSSSIPSSLPLQQLGSGKSNNFTAMTRFSNQLRTTGQTLQGRLPQMPNIPNIPQPPQLPGMPPGMMQMAGLALPFAMARATRGNRIRNQQVNAAAQNGGTTAGQRLINSASRLVRSRRRPTNSPVGTNSQSPSRGPNRNRRLAGLIQTVVDMRRRPPVATNASHKTGNKLVATALAVATTATASIPKLKPKIDLADRWQRQNLYTKSKRLSRSVMPHRYNNSNHKSILATINDGTLSEFASMTSPNYHMAQHIAQDDQMRFHSLPQEYSFYKGGSDSTPEVNQQTTYGHIPIYQLSGQQIYNLPENLGPSLFSLPSTSSSWKQTTTTTTLKPQIIKLNKVDNINETPLYQPEDQYDLNNMLQGSDRNEAPGPQGSSSQEPSLETPQLIENKLSDNKDISDEMKPFMTSGSSDSVSKDVDSEKLPQVNKQTTQVPQIGSTTIAEPPKDTLTQPIQTSTPTTSTTTVTPSILIQDKTSTKEPMLKYKRSTSFKPVESSKELDPDEPHGTTVDTLASQTEIVYHTDRDYNSHKSGLGSGTKQMKSGSQVAKTPSDDYVRAIKLVRGVAFPWPPPTKGSMILRV